MTDNLKTIDLDSLNSYTENLGSFVSDDLMPLPSPKDILALNDELIDNYTGNGITKRGSVKIDENGIASGFSNSSNTILTSLNCMSLNDGFELQVKASTRETGSIFCESTLGGDSNICFYVSLRTNKTEVGSWYNGHWYGVDLYFGAIPENKMHYFRYKYSNNTIYFKVLDEEMNVLSEQSAPLTLHLRNRTFMFGRNMDNYYQSPYTAIDLSETWFKDKNGNLISSWNK